MKTLILLAILTLLVPLTQIHNEVSEPEKIKHSLVVKERPVVIEETTTTQETHLPEPTFPEPTLERNWVAQEISKIELPKPPATLQDLVNEYFEPEDREWALRVAFCESTGFPEDTISYAVNKSSGAAGWFQHLPKFWEERSMKAGIPDGDIMDPENNVLVASWLLYETPQRTSHWYPSEHCWG